MQSRAELRLLASCASHHNASNACIVFVGTIHAFHINNILLVPSSKSQIRPQIRMEAKGTDEDSDVSQSCHGGSLSVVSKEVTIARRIGRFVRDLSGG